MGPSSRPGPVLGHLCSKKYFFFFSKIDKEGEFVFPKPCLSTAPQNSWFQLNSYFVRIHFHCTFHCTQARTYVTNFLF